MVRLARMALEDKMAQMVQMAQLVFKAGVVKRVHLV